jgi:hypothetical protein
MWATFSLLAALSLTPGQSGPLQLTNARTTYGSLGPTRPEGKFLPGDVCFLRFDIENLKTDGSGRVVYSTVLEVFDSKGERKYKGEPEPYAFVNALGGSRVAASSLTIFGNDVEPGEYSMQVTVKDLVANKSETIKRKVEVAPKDFGIIQVYSTYDDAGQFPAPAVASPGQMLWLHASAVGFTRDSKTNQPKLTFEYNIFDENKNSTLEKPFAFTVSEGVPEGKPQVPGSLDLRINRAGKFTIELTVTDQLAKDKKAAKLVFPITVVEPK